MCAQVHDHLARQAPANLLSQELWAASANAAHWWHMHRTYTSSLAMSSVAGYLLGLGDRHLNNILYLPAKGDVVHVDLSVCFDQGQSLRIPEVVPFRMTQVLAHALGPLGCAGPFSTHAQVRYTTGLSICCIQIYFVCRGVSKPSLHTPRCVCSAICCIFWTALLALPQVLAHCSGACAGAAGLRGCVGTLFFAQDRTPVAD